MERYVIVWRNIHTGAGSVSQNIEADSDADARQKAEAMYDGFEALGWTYVLTDAHGRRL